MPDVCVLIAVHNGAPWIEEALDSALAQQGVDAEVLVVDDGSTDATPEILRRRAVAAPGKIRVISLAHCGRAQARNIGADNVEAEFICYLDADDRMHPLRVKLECDALRAFPEALVSFSGRWNFDDGADVGTWVYEPEAFGAPPGQLFTRLDDPISALLAAGGNPGHNACTCRTSWARGCGRFDPDYEVFEDPERWLRCLHDTPVVYVAAPLYQRRLHPAGARVPWATIARAQFAALDAAHARWPRYRPEQRARIARFEKEVAASVALLAAQTHGRATGIGFLLRHALRLHSAPWWRALTYLLAPPFLLSAWRRRKPANRAVGGPSVPLAEAMVPEPARIWSQGAAAGHGAGRPGPDQAPEHVGTGLTSRMP